MRIKYLNLVYRNVRKDSILILLGKLYIILSISVWIIVGISGMLSGIRIKGRICIDIDVLIVLLLFIYRL